MQNCFKRYHKFNAPKVVLVDKFHEAVLVEWLVNPQELTYYGLIQCRRDLEEVHNSLDVFPVVCVRVWYQLKLSELRNACFPSGIEFLSREGVLLLQASLFLKILKLIVSLAPHTTSRVVKR